ncbi:MAG: SpaA isopeptide-forming pilin-related protein [Lachnospiraceae bacterium]|nr:SpaA isopeptide-forming pilin-related protein [Lachnospiraceae bacterium]
MDFIFRAAEKFLKDHKRLMRYRRVFAVLAAVVVFATTYELILPAITIDRQRAAETPGMEVGVAAEEVVEENEEEDSGEDEEEAEAAEEESRTEAEQTQENEDTGSSDAAAEESADPETVENTDAGDADQANADNGADAAVNESAEGNADSKETTEASADAASGTNAAATEEAAATATTEAPAVEYPVTLTYEGDGYTITATFDETANLPAGVSLDALEILPDMVYRDEDGNVLYDDYEVYLEKTVETLEKDGRLEDSYVASARFFDISFIDPEGNYVEPAAPVTVSVKYKEALSAEDTVSTVAVHFNNKNDKTEVIETEEDIKKDTIQEVSFDAEQFSVYGIVGTKNGEVVSSAVGEKITLTGEGSDSKYHTWTSSDTGIATVLWNKAECYVTCKATGSVTVTHNWGDKANKQNNTETFIVTITDGEVTELTEVAGGVTVKVNKLAGTNKLLNGKELVVEETTSGSDYNSYIELLEDDTVLGIYDIYLKDTETGERSELPSGSKLKVTITADYLNNGESVNVGHYKNPSTPLGVMNENDQAIEKVTVSAKSISFRITSFSTFTISSGSSGGTSGGGSGNTIVPAQEGSILNNLTYADDNAWQIVSGTQYSGNDAGNKTPSSDGWVRVQKNIIPTGVENEFYVYLSVDTKSETVVNTSVIGQYINTASFYARTSNTFQTGVNEGDWINAITITHGSEMNVWIDANATLKKGQVEDLTLKAPDGTVIGTFRVCAANSNGTMYLPLSTGGYIAMFNFKAHDTSGTITLSDAAYSYLVKEITETTSTGTSITNLSVTELIDTDRFRIDSVITDSDSSYNQATGVWTINDNTAGTNTTTTKTGEGTSTVTTTTWTENAAELLYKVTLKTTDAAFNSSAGEYFIGSKPATAAYTHGSTNGTTTFPNVSVKGLQYDVKIKKVDQDGNPMSGVQFTLTGNDGNGLVSGGYNKTETTDSNGYITFAGMAWGTYTITEGTPPAGYRKADPQTATLCYTTEPDVLSDIACDVGTDKIRGAQSPLEFVNHRNSITVTKAVAWYPAADQADNIGNVNQTIYIALKNKSTGEYVKDSSGNIIYKTITITNGVPTPASVTFGENEAIDTGEYDVMELSAVNGSSATELKAGDRFTSNNKRIQVYSIAAQETNTGSDGTVTSVNGNDADLRYSNTSTVAFTNTYSNETTMNFTTYKKWTDPDGKDIEAPQGSSVTFTLYQNDSEYTKPDGKTYTITLDGTVDTDGELTAWQATFSELPVTDASGQQYNYTVKETDCTNADFECVTTGGVSQSGGSITNKQKTTSITVKKVDKNSSAFVAGAKFKLFKVGDSDVIVGDEFTIESEDGYRIDGLTSGLYKLTETAAPAGYIITDRDITFTVNAKGSGSVVTWNGGAKPANVKGLSQTNNTDDTITVINTPGVELPETGGTGFLSPQTLCGIMAMAFVLATAVMYGFSMRRGERRYK